MVISPARESRPLLRPTPREDLLTGAGRDPAAMSTVFAYEYVAGSLNQLAATFTPFATTYGVNVEGGELGF